MKFSDLISNVPQFDLFNQSTILDAQGMVIGYSTVAIDKAGIAIGGGIHSLLETSQRIALAESLERSIFNKICDDVKLKKDFYIEEYPTTCGFAAGFEDEKTKLRAVCEAIERWAWSKWIDEGFSISKSERPEILSPITQNFIKNFDNVLFYKKQFEITFEDKILPLTWGVLLGIKGGGIFPGSRVCGINEDPWEHSSVEAWRHFHMFNSSKIAPYKKNFYLDRVLHFATKLDLALASIPKNNFKTWPVPKIDFCKKFEGITFSLWRALSFDYIGWEKGNIDRFIY